MTQKEVVLLFPYFRRPSATHLFQPLGIASLAAELETRGVRAVQVDGTFMTPDAVVSRIASEQPAIVGMTVLVTLMRSALSLLALLRRELPHTLFVAGGPHPSVMPEFFGSHFDLVFRGEADRAFPDFCRDTLDNGLHPGDIGKCDLSGYPGAFISRQGKAFVDIPQEHLAEAEIADLPNPDRSQADHQAYQQACLERGDLPQASIMLTRGCPFACDFCSRPIFGDLFRKRPLDGVFTEIQEIRRLGYESLWIADDSFTLSLDYLAGFCERMRREGPGVTWTCLSRVDSLTPEIVGEMAASGCVRVYLGLESASDETLRLMNKKTTVADGKRAVALFNAAGIGVGGFFMVGYPGETVESIEKTFEMALSLPFDDISINVPYPLPGSPLYSRVDGMLPGEDWEWESEPRFLYRSEFDESWIRTRIQQTLDAFKNRHRAAQEGNR